MLALSKQPESEVIMPDLNSKACTKCGCVKPVSEFHKSSGKQGGFASRCKTCCTEYQKSYGKIQSLVSVAPHHKLCPRCNITKPAAEFFPNSVRKDQLSVYCKDCQRAYLKEKSYDKKRWAKMSDTESERNRKYRDANSAQLREKWRENSIAKRERNPGAIRSNNIARKYSQKKATPPWADMSKVNAFYKEARRLEALDGIKRNVDHIVPIHHPLVCGLHVEHNLQVLTASENMSKHNKFEVQ